MTDVSVDDHLVTDLNAYRAAVREYLAGPALDRWRGTYLDDDAGGDAVLGRADARAVRRGLRALRHVAGRGRARRGRQALGGALRRADAVRDHPHRSAQPAGHAGLPAGEVRAAAGRRVPARVPVRRRLVGAGLLRVRGGQRPRRAALPGQAGLRRLRHLRAQDLDQPRRDRQPDLPAGADRHAREPAPRPVDDPRRRRRARCHRAPDQASQRAGRTRRVLLRRRPRPGRPADRRGGRGLGGRHVPAPVRAGGRGPGCAPRSCCSGCGRWSGSCPAGLPRRRPTVPLSARYWARSTSTCSPFARAAWTPSAGWPPGRPSARRPARTSCCLERASRACTTRRGRCSDPAFLFGDASRQWREEWWYSRTTTVYGGSAEVQRGIIADRVLKLPKD